MRRELLILVKVTVLSGSILWMAACTPHRANLAPRPVIEAPSYSFDAEAKEALPAERDWWEAFDDPVLKHLIESALASNPSIEQGVSRLLQAEAVLRQARAARYPAVDLEITSRQDGHTAHGFTSQNRGGIALFWNPDLFGELRSSQLARLYEYQSTHFAHQDLRLQISVQVAQTYFAAMEQRLQLDLLKEQIAVDSELLDLVERNFAAGVVSRVDLLQQRAQLVDTESLVPLAELALRIFENRLDVLLATPPDGLDRATILADFPDAARIPAPGIPSDLLLRRPDLQESRAALIAADAEIGIAIAQRLPRLMLDGSLLYSVGSGTAGGIAEILAGLSQPLLDWGAKRAEVTRSEALYSERLFAFTQKYLDAIEEVENTAFQILRQEDYLSRLLARKEILAETLEETRRRYTAGLTDYLPVLDTLQELHRLERHMLTQKRLLISLQITLHQALGGGILNHASDAT